MVGYFSGKWSVVPGRWSAALWSMGGGWSVSGGFVLRRKYNGTRMLDQALMRVMMSINSF